MYEPNEKELREMNFQNEENVFYLEIGNYFTLQYDFIANQWKIVTSENEEGFNLYDKSDVIYLINFFKNRNP